MQLIHRECLNSLFLRKIRQTRLFGFRHIAQRQTDYNAAPHLPLVKIPESIRPRVRHYAKRMPPLRLHLKDSNRNLRRGKEWRIGISSSSARPPEESRAGVMQWQEGNSKS